VGRQIGWHRTTVPDNSELRAQKYGWEYSSSHGVTSVVVASPTVFA
jgi:hypothetical protein